MHIKIILIQPVRYIFIALLFSINLNAEIILIGANDPKELFENAGQIRILDALAKKDFDVVEKELLTTKIDQKGKNGETILWWQANIGNLDAFEYLLVKGANPLHQVKDGPNIVELCAMQQNSGFIKAALKHGVNPNMISQYDRQTPVFAAVMHRRSANIEILIKAGACLDIADPMGTTPVIAASDQGAFDIVELLLRNGANKSWKTIQGHNLAASLAQAKVENDSIMKDHLAKVKAMLLD